MDKIVKIFIEFGYVYSLFAIFIIGFICYEHLGYSMRKKETSIGDINTFYFGKRTERKSFRNIKNIRVGTVFYGIIISFFICLSNSAIASVNGIEKIWNGTGTYVDAIPAVMITTYITLITFLGIFSKWENKKCITYTIDDIIDKYSIIEQLKKMSLLTGATYLFLFASIIVKNITVYEMYFGIKSLVLVYFVYYIWLFMRIIWIFIDLLMGSKIEHKMLDNLYREFWYKPLGKIENYWTDDVVRAQIEYLIENYIKYSKKIKYSRISFDTNFKVEENSRFQKLKIKSSLIVAIVTTIIITISSSGTLLAHNEMILPYCIGCLVYIIVVWISGITLRGLSTIFIGIVYDRKGYEIETKNRLIKKRYVCDVGMYESNKYFHYIKATKNIIAFACLAIHENQEKSFNIIVQMCKNKIDSDETIYIILLVLDYFHYRNKKCFNNTIVNDINAMKYCDSAKSFIFDIERKIKNGDIQSKAVDRYFKIRFKYLTYIK